MGFAARLVVTRNDDVATEGAEAADEVAFERMQFRAMVKGEARNENAGAVETHADQRVQQALDLPVAGFFVAFQAENDQAGDEKNHRDEFAQRKGLAEEDRRDKSQADGLKAVENECSRNSESRVGVEQKQITDSEAQGTGEREQAEGREVGCNGGREPCRVENGDRGHEQECGDEGFDGVDPQDAESAGKLREDQTGA